MFTLNANAANTKDLGIGTTGAPGEGRAQVFNPLPWIEQANRRADKIAAEKKAREQKQQDKLNAALAGLGDSIFARDKELFVKKQDEIKNLVYKNSDKLTAGDTGSWVELQDKINSFHQEAKLSNEAGKQWTINQHLLENNPEGTFRGGETVSSFNTPEKAGLYDNSQMQMSKKFPLASDMAKVAEGELKLAQQEGRVFTRTPEEAAKHVDNLMTDPTKAIEAQHLYAESTEGELNAKGLTKNPDNKDANLKKVLNATDYAHAMFDPLFTVHNVKPAPANQGYGTQNVKFRVNAEVAPTSDGEVDGSIKNWQNSYAPTYINNPDNPSEQLLVVPTDWKQTSDGGYIGVAKVPLTEDQKTENQLIKSENFAAKKNFDTNILPTWEDDKNRFIKKVNPRTKEGQDAIAQFVKDNPEPTFNERPLNKEKTIDINDSQETINAFHEAYGADITKLSQGNNKGQEHIRLLQSPKSTSQKIHSATRAEWKANGWTDDQINKAEKQGKIIVK